MVDAFGIPIPPKEVGGRSHSKGSKNPGSKGVGSKQVGASPQMSKQFSAASQSQIFTATDTNFGGGGTAADTIDTADILTQVKIEEMFEE